VVVTGGAGFVGSHVAEAFAGLGYDVLAIDDLSTGRRENLSPDAELAVVDITDAEALRDAIAGFRPDVICHLAAQSSVTVSVHSPRLDLDVNVVGTFNVCELGAELRAPVIFASTGGALYGDSAPLPTAEDQPPEPGAPYGAAKLAGEAYVATWGRLHGTANVVLRLGNVYGPRQRWDGEAGVVAMFSDRLLRGEPPTVYGDGEQTRDYVHVRDVAAAFVAAATSGRAGTLNVSRGIGTSVNELLDALQEAAGTDLEPRFEPLRRGELKRSAISPARIERELGWVAKVELRPGLAETFAWYAADHGAR